MITGGAVTYTRFPDFLIPRRPQTRLCISLIFRGSRNGTLTNIFWNGPLEIMNFDSDHGSRPYLHEQPRSVPASLLPCCGQQLLLLSGGKFTRKRLCFVIRLEGAGRLEGLRSTRQKTGVVTIKAKQGAYLLVQEVDRPLMLECFCSFTL